MGLWPGHSGAASHYAVYIDRWMSYKNGLEAYEYARASCRGVNADLGERQYMVDFGGGKWPT